MSVQAIAWVLEHSETRLASRLVMLSIANHSKADGTGAWPSYESIGQEAGISRRHAYRLVGQLIAEGHLTVDEKGGPKGTNLYSIGGMARDILSTDKSDTSDLDVQLGTFPASARDKSSNGSGENVPRTVREPKTEPSQNPVALQERDGVWQAMVELWGQPPKNDRLRTSWGIAAKEIRAQGLSGKDVRRRYGNAGPDRQWAVATPMAFAKHMGVLERPAARQPKGAVERVLARAAEMEQR